MASGNWRSSDRMSNLQDSCCAKELAGYYYSELRSLLSTLRTMTWIKMKVLRTMFCDFVSRVILCS